MSDLVLSSEGAAYLTACISRRAASIHELVCHLNRARFSSQVVDLLERAVAAGLPRNQMLLPLLKLDMDFVIVPNKTLPCFYAALNFLLDCYGSAVVPLSLLHGFKPFRLIVGDDKRESEEVYYLSLCLRAMIHFMIYKDGEKSVVKAGVADVADKIRGLSQTYREPILGDEDVFKSTKSISEFHKNWIGVVKKYVAHVFKHFSNKP